MTRFQLRTLREQASRGSFYLDSSEMRALKAQNPKLVYAWQAAEASADYLEVLLEREIASSPEEE